MSSDVLLPNTYVITVTAFQGNYSQYRNKTSSFSLLIIDPCRNIVLSYPNIPNYTYNISDPPLIIPYQSFTDNLNICGNYNFTSHYQNGSTSMNTTVFKFDFLNS